MSIDTNVAAVTERDADPVTAAEVAVIVTGLPLLFATPVAIPNRLIVTRLVFPELQMTLFVKSVELPSE